MNINQIETAWKEVEEKISSLSYLEPAEARGAVAGSMTVAIMLEIIKKEGERNGIQDNHN